MGHRIDIKTSLIHGLPLAVVFGGTGFKLTGVDPDARNATGVMGKCSPKVERL